MVEISDGLEIRDKIAVGAVIGIDPDFACRLSCPVRVGAA